MFEILNLPMSSLWMPKISVRFICKMLWFHPSVFRAVAAFLLSLAIPSDATMVGTEGKNIRFRLACTARKWCSRKIKQTKNIRINTRNSYLKLNHPFRKTSTRQNRLFYIGPAVWKRIPQIFKKTKNLNTFKYKMKYDYLNDLSNPNYEILVDLIIRWLS